MFALPRALNSLGAYRQFIVYQVVPSPKRPGKTDKFPIDWRTGQVANAHDPAIWLDWQTAATTAEAFGPSYGVGFVLTASCGHFFIDVDECLVDDAWSPIAMELLSRFQGAAVEISFSWRGLHILGRGQAPTDRRVKYLDKFDLYTDGRFVALTGHNIIGDSSTDHTAALTALVAQYLVADHGTASDWSTAPVPGWRGPEDDTVLIDRALRSQSAAQAFGTKASFKDLYEANVDVLAKCYPDDHKQRPYDDSKADSALAQHLAFWTGKNCDRIERIMRTSALVRPKWEERDDYLQRTILGVVARQYDVLADKAAEQSGLTAATVGAAVGRPVTGDTFLTTQEQLELFKGCIYVCNIHRALVPGGHLLKPEQFKVMFGGYSFPMDPVNERVSRNAWEAFTESQSYRSPRADGICFRPDHDPGAIMNDAGTTLANMWWPIETPQAEGDPAPFLLHLTKLLPDEGDRASLLAFVASLVQNPGRKFQWAPLVQGVKGNGKTLVATAVARCVGDRYTHFPNAADLSTGGLKFTNWINGKLFIGIEEIYTGDRRETMEGLKPIITNSRIEIQGKGQDQYTGDNRANIIAFSNHKDAVPKTDDERRWAIYYTAQQDFADLERDGMTGAYFPNLWDWFEGRGRYADQPPGYAVINRFLRAYVIPDELNPAVGSHRAPNTTSTPEAIRLSAGGIEQEIMEAIEQELPGFAGGWISSMAVDKLLTRLKADRRIPPKKRREMLTRMGYDPHPALVDGRVNNSIQPDGGKPRLYVKRGHILMNLPTAAMAAHKYTEAQTKALTSNANFGVAS
jgi:hypothetical protein